MIDVLVPANALISDLGTIPDGVRLVPVAEGAPPVAAEVLVFGAEVRHLLPRLGDIEGLRLIQTEVQRCKGIVDSLLDFSRPKASDKVLVNVNEAIERTLFVLKHHTRFRKLAVHVELDRSLSAVVRANIEQLMQVFMALLMNGMDAMDERGTITLRTRWGSDAKSVVAEIIDQGGGIRRADLPKLFEPFFTTKAPGRGTGLGLSICYAIVAEHGGRIEVDSDPGEGSVFRIILPRADTAEGIL